MNDREFQETLDEMFNNIEDLVDELDLDVDASAGLLSIEFPDSSSVILSRQIANHELWVAAKSGSFHLALKDGQWNCATTDETLNTLLNRVFTEQLQQTVETFNSLT